MNNNINFLKTALVLLGSTLCSAGVMAGQMPDSQGANTYVKTATISATNPPPVLFVTSNGKEYTHVEDDGKPKTWLARVSGECRTIAYVDGANYNLNNTKYNGGNVATKKLDLAPGKNKTFGHNVAVSIQWAPDSSVKNKALDACKQHMASEKKKGKTLFDILGKDKHLVIDSGVYGAFHMSCAGYIGLSGGVKHRFDMQPVEVRCLGSDVALNIPAEKVKLMEISSASFSPVVPKYEGMCPKDFSFNGSIKTNGEGGKVRYRFKNHMGVTSAWKNATIAKGNTSYAISHTIKLQDIQVNENPGLPNQIQGQQGGAQPLQQMDVLENPYEILEVEHLGNKKKYSSKASYTFKCKRLNPVLGTQKGDIHKPVPKKPDLTVLGNTFQLGNVKASGDPAALMLTVGSDEASRKVGGQCEFRMRYSIKNLGNDTAQPTFINRTSEGAKTLHTSSTPKLDKGQEKIISGNVKLKPGVQMVVVKTDDTSKISESNENNNMVRIKVIVRGDCAGPSTPPRPGANPSTPPRPGSIPSIPRPSDPTGTPPRPAQ